jgi:hypothetical protein
MSSGDLTLTFEHFAHCARAGVLRLALYRGETLCIPRSRRHLRVLSGAAWLTHCGQDVVLKQGQGAHLRRCRDPAIISGLKDQGLFFEVW